MEQVRVEVKIYWGVKVIVYLYYIDVAELEKVYAPTLRAREGQVTPLSKNIIFSQF